MAEITAALVKDLREKSGAGMMDCKKALAETGGDLESAVDWLRKKGLAAAAKKSGRVAAEGLIGLALGGNAGALVEVNAETDFVARNERFQRMVQAIAQVALAQGGEVERIKAAPFPGGSRSVQEEITHAIATIGENMNLRRAARLSAEPGVVAGYMHGALAENAGKIGVIVALKSSGKREVLERFGRQLAMHIAAANPQAVTPDRVDAGAIERERAILREQAAASGKKADIVEKMVEGRLRKFYEEVALLEQVWVIDGETRVKQAVANAAKEAGAPIEVTAFHRYALGEGIDKKTDDFAAEVAKMTK